MLSRLTGFVCPTVSMVTTGHATGVEKTLLLKDRQHRAAADLRYSRLSLTLSFTF